jgi:predicted PhzF superfamily epimerase YddE/YHI9
MTTFPFMQVDAFTDRPLSGNPCDEITAVQVGGQAVTVIRGELVI